MGWLAENIQQLFGFQLKKEKVSGGRDSIVPPEADGSQIIEVASGGGLLQSLNLGDNSKNESELIKKYRIVSLQPEAETAIDDIINEAIITDEVGDPVDINLDSVEKLSASIKNQIKEEFSKVLKLLDFKTSGYDIFKRFYVDGRLYYDKVVDEKKPSKGIIELRQIDARTITKIKEVQKEKNAQGIDVEVGVQEFFVYVPKPKNMRTGINTVSAIPNAALKVSPDRITFIHSGLIDPDTGVVLSHLHKAIKPINQLQLIEDSTVIYRLSRAPERRIFYIDVGTLPKVKAEQYMKEVMNQYKNKTIYDSQTGEVINQRNHLSMLEDFFLPRREGGRGTQIETLGGGTTLGNNEETEYFKRKLYKSLNVPVSRSESDTAFNIGRAAEISRDEIKFSKFITRLRTRFGMLFSDILRTQLILKGVMKLAEWDEIAQDVAYDFLRDSHFTELKEAEILSNRLETLELARDSIGKYFSNAYVRRNILHQNDEEIETIKKEIEDEEKSGEIGKDEKDDEDAF